MTVSGLTGATGRDAGAGASSGLDTVTMVDHALAMHTEHSHPVELFREDGAWQTVVTLPLLGNIQQHGSGSGRGESSGTRGLGGVPLEAWSLRW